MRRVVPVLILFLALFSSAFAANPLPAPATTLAEQVGNNTSAANTFLSAPDGNLGAGNISKVPIRSLLYPGATTKLYAHVEPWWGSSSHIDIGYSSQDPVQIKRQVDDMISRGLDGLAVDWYGPGSYSDLSDKLLLTEVEQHSGFSMFIEIDQGAIKWYTPCYPASCNGTQAAIQLFTTAASQFFSSSSYVRIGGRPVVREFGMEAYNVDWNAVQAAVPGNPLIVHRNTMGFTDPQSGGVFGWIEPIAAPNVPSGYDGMDYVNSLYTKATATYPAVTMFATVFKGFNDIAASWAPPGGRHVEQNCGQTWLRSFQTINKYYSAAHQLPALQLVTWNDYEEGTEVESGIDNCVTVSAWIAGNTVQWNITGDESTVDHYTVYLSTDGQKLARLGDVASGTHMLDLSQFTIPAGTYSAFVQAIGKPVLKNQMSVAAQFSAAASGALTAKPGSGKNVSISAFPGSATVSVSQAAPFQLVVSETGASDPVSLSCSHLPAGMGCSFSPASMTPGVAPATASLNVTTSPAVAALHAPALPRRGLPGFPLWMSGLGAVGMVGLPEMSRRRRRALLVVSLFIGIALLLTACGGGGAAKGNVSSAASSQPTTVATGTYTITVNATAGAVTSSTNVTVTVR